MENTSRSLWDRLTDDLGLTEREIARHLSPQLGNMYRLIGLQKTVLFVEHFAAQKVTVPVRHDNDNTLTRLLGTEAAEKMIERYGGSHINFGNPFSFKFFVNQEVRRGLLDGLSVNDVVKRSGLSRSTIQLIRRGLPLTKVRNSRADSAKIEAVAMLKAGVPIEDVAKATGRSSFTVRKYFYEAGLRGPAKTKPKPKKKRDQVSDLIDEGYGNHHIHGVTGVSSVTIAKWRRELKEMRR